MLLWVIMASMTGAAVMAVLWPLSRSGRAARHDGATDLDFYRHQLRELDRELDRALISPAEAEAARAEAGRRLLRAQAALPMGGDTTGEPALRRRRVASALGLCIVPLVGLAVYGAIGSPNSGGRPEAAVAAPPGAPAGFAEAVAQVEKHLAGNPEDLRGWDVIAPIYLRSGRFEEAEKAFATARRLGGDTADRLTGFGEALVSGAGGIVSGEAAQAFTKALSIDAGSVRARFYLALAAEQDGQKEQARAEYARIVAEAPAGAPWLPVVRERLVQVGGPAEEGTATALAPSAVSPEIRSMVEGLDARLAGGGGTEAEWSRLVRSYVVLGQPDLAVDRLARARTALAADRGAAGRLDSLAGDLGLLQRKAAR